MEESRCVEFVSGHFVRGTAISPKQAHAGYEPYIGEITMYPYMFAPQGWLKCEGQLLSINQNAALFSLLGTNFGGDGMNTFALPDLRGASRCQM